MGNRTVTRKFSRLNSVNKVFAAAVHSSEKESTDFHMKTTDFFFARIPIFCFTIYFIHEPERVRFQRLVDSKVQRRLNVQQSRKQRALAVGLC